MSQFKPAPVNMFTTLHSSLLRGRVLQDIKAIQASILNTKRVAPLLVTRRPNGRLTIVDGRKRLAAIRRLEFMGQLPPSLEDIPYTEIASLRRDTPVRPKLRLAA